MVVLNFGGHTHYLSLQIILKSGRNITLCGAIGSDVLSSLLDGIGQLGQNEFGILPTDTCIGDGDCVFETRLSFLGHLLVALVDVRFDHDTHDGFFTSGNLGREFVGDLGLVLVILLGIAVAVLRVSVHAVA